MRRPLLAPLLPALLALACSGAPAGSTPPPGAAPAGQPDAPDRAEDDGNGFAEPAQPAATPPGDPPKSDVPPELAARIKREFGERCRHERACGELIGVDCESAVDGPYYYVKRETLEVVSRCGGACRMGCTDCPPKAWTCPTY